MTTAPTHPRPAPRRELLRFVLRLGLLLGVLLWLAARAAPLQRWLQSVEARQTAALLRLLGHPARASHDFVMLRGAGLQVTPDCVALYPAMAYAAAVLAFPASWWQRVAGVAAGLATIYLVNEARLLSLAWLMIRDPAMALTLHDTGWRAAQLLIFAGIFFVWLRWSGAPAPRPAAVTRT